MLNTENKEKINLIADFTEPFYSDWDRRQHVNIEAFASSGYSRGILKEIRYINPQKLTGETAQKVFDEMIDTFNFYKENDKEFVNYELSHTYIRKPREFK